MSTSKSFNQIVKGEPVCIKIDTKYPVTKQTEQANIKSFFSETICENKVQVTDVAFQTTSTFIHKADGKVELKMQQSIFVCFDQWISDGRSDRSDGRSDRSDGRSNRSGVSYTSFMNEMSECFANGGLLRGDSFLCDIADFDTSDWVITYFDSIRHIDEIL